MSGRKFSEVELRNTVREAIECQTQAREAVERAQCLAAALQAVAETVDELRTSADAAANALEESRKQLENMEKDFDWSRMMQLDITEVRRRRSAVGRLSQELEQIVERCRAGNNAGAVRAELAAVRAQLEDQRSNLEPWLGEAYADYVSKTHQLIAEIDAEIRATGSLTDGGSKAREQAAEFGAIREKASLRRAEDSQRRYIADALRRVCAELAFQATVLPQKSPLDDIVVEVNTFAYGILHFRLELGGTIRSQSELPETTCCANFSIIEDRLRSLGVISAFRYEADQSPVRIEKGSKELNDPGSPKAAAEGSRS